MRKHLSTVLAAAALIVGLAATPLLQAYADAPGSRGSDGMMEGMRGGMMEHCNEMMQGMDHGQGAQVPNEQWRDRQPAPQEPPTAAGGQPVTKA